MAGCRFGFGVLLLVFLHLGSVPQAANAGPSSIFEGLQWPWSRCKLRPGVDDPVALGRMLKGADPRLHDGCNTHTIVGQHIAINTVPYVVAAHLSNPSPSKPLVLMFVGPPGVGKTMFETALRRSLFSDASADGEGRGVHVISGVDLRDQTDLQFGLEMANRIARQVRGCARSLIVVDELQFLNKNTLGELVDLLGHRQPIKHPNYSTPIDYRKAVFVMTSNDGSEDITRVTARVIGDPTRGGGNDGVGRAALEYADFDELLKTRFAKKEGWLARKNRVDYYIPFLPIQPAQVRAQVALQISRFNCSESRRGAFPRLVWDEAVVDLLAAKEQAADIDFNPNGLSHVVEPTLAIALFSKVSTALAMASVGKDQVAEVAATVVDGGISIAVVEKDESCMGESCEAIGQPLPVPTRLQSDTEQPEPTRLQSNPEPSTEL